MCEKSISKAFTREWKKVVFNNSRLVIAWPQGGKKLPGINSAGDIICQIGGLKMPEDLEGT